MSYELVQFSIVNVKAGDKVYENDPVLEGLILREDSDDFEVITAEDIVDVATEDPVEGLYADTGQVGVFDHDATIVVYSGTMSPMADAARYDGGIAEEVANLGQQGMFADFLPDILKAANIEGGDAQTRSILTLWSYRPHYHTFTGEYDVDIDMVGLVNWNDLTKVVTTGEA